MPTGCRSTSADLHGRCVERDSSHPSDSDSSPKSFSTWSVAHQAAIPESYCVNIATNEIHGDGCPIDSGVVAD